MHSKLYECKLYGAILKIQKIISLFFNHMVEKWVYYGARQGSAWVWLKSNSFSSSRTMEKEYIKTCLFLPLCSIAKPCVCISCKHVLFYLKLPCTWILIMILIVKRMNICVPNFEFWIMLTSQFVTDTLLHLVCQTTGILCDLVLLLKLRC